MLGLADYFERNYNGTVEGTLLDIELETTLLGLSRDSSRFTSEHRLAA